ncbi:MAG: WYL domain-containing protein, partial [Muribaculum sp.]|nr:WYL domain-containing protein [Muribaculum sp.]
GYAAPIETYPLDGKKCYYQYSDRDFRIFRKEISEEAMEAVRKTIGILNQYRGLPTNGWIEEVISSIEVNLGMKPNVENLVSLDRNSELQGLQFLSDLIDYTIASQPLDITYRPFGRDARVVTLHPYHVKQYNNRWFLWGLDEQRGCIANLALDRIEKIMKSAVAFRPNDLVDFSTFFDDVIGVTVPGDDVPCQTFQLQFTPGRFPYIVSKPMHRSQRVVSERKCIISVSVKPNREFESLIFSYGADVKILSPLSFRDHFAEKINQLQKYYESVKKKNTRTTLINKLLTLDSFYYG